MSKNAAELNKIFQKAAPQAYKSLSELGKRLFLPKAILIQGAEAQEKAPNMNATIGIATEHGEALHLKSIHKNIESLKPNEIFPYAGSSGVASLRKQWKDLLYKKNPHLHGKEISTPIVTAGITHGLSLAGDLFINPGDTIIIPDQFWENYELTYIHRYGAQFAHYRLFDENGALNTHSFQTQIEKRAKDLEKLIILLNFPNNPTGYSPTQREAEKLVQIITEYAASGKRIICIFDDAYFGFTYEKVLTESLFAFLTQAHENILSIKVDGATKEYYAWGLRIGFITYGLTAKNTQEAYRSLEEKTTGAIRSSISNAPKLSQTLIEKALKAETLEAETKKLHNTLKSRQEEIKRILAQEKYKKAFHTYPYNSGYFTAHKLHKANAEKLRQHLLNKHQTGIVSIGDSDIRIAFSAVAKEKLDKLYETIYQAIEELNTK